MPSSFIRFQALFAAELAAPQVSDHGSAGLRGSQVEDARKFQAMVPLSFHRRGPICGENPWAVASRWQLGDTFPIHHLLKVLGKPWLLVMLNKVSMLEGDNLSRDKAQVLMFS